MTGEEERAFRISRTADAVWIGAEARAFAATLGFTTVACGEIAIAASELVTNASKHAEGGTLRLARIAQEGRVGLEICGEDCGPGIADLEKALADGYSEGRFLDPDEPRERRRGLGAGLGAVQRLMDELVVEQRSGGGTRIIARKWLA